MATSDDAALISRVEQFYFREARMLDERRFQQWFNELVDPAIEYSMPARHVPQPDMSGNGEETLLAVDRELERADDSHGSPIRIDHFMETMVRTMRPYNARAWAENPPPRTRRMISNVEVQSTDGAYLAYSNFMLFYSHAGTDNHLYTGGRRDRLVESDGEFRIARREVITDWDVITVPTLALIF